jgi:hypothetical protein
MIDEAQQQLDASIDHFLALMHKYSSAYHVGRGYPARAAGTEQYIASRQYDGDNGASDGDADHATGAAVSAIVDRITDPHRTCLRIEGRNLVTGVKVWTSARLPLCPVERSIIRLEARNRLWQQLTAQGLT